MQKEKSMYIMGLEINLKRGGYELPKVKDPNYYIIHFLFYRTRLSFAREFNSWNYIRRNWINYCNSSFYLWLKQPRHLAGFLFKT
jgi:hypothetical protein